jgi:hypothetical protein
MNGRKMERGQSIIETAIVLLVLVLILYGVVEVGFGLRNYLLVCNANREAARFAARGRSTDQLDQVAERLVSSGGVERITGLDVPFLRTVYPEHPVSGNPILAAPPNTGIIITYIPMDAAGEINPDEVKHYAEGVIACGACDGVDEELIVVPGMRIINAGDTLVVWDDVVARHKDLTIQINQDRVDNDLARQDNQIIIVETFFAHHPWGSGLVPDPWVMYTHTEMRITTGRGTP